MQAYRCKCGEAKYFGSDVPKPCQGCKKCGTTYAQHPDHHKEIEPHEFEILYDDKGRPYEVCKRCYEHGRKFGKPMMLPGTQAMHAWITDKCRLGRTDAGVIDEVVKRLCVELEATLEGWDCGKGAKIHIGMTVERPEDQ